MIRPDLHLHTTASDGVLSPESLAAAAEQAGLTLMAVTDHDTFQGSDALRGRPGPRLIPGVELSMADMHGLHILCYGLGEGRPLRQRVRELAEKRIARAEQICEKLAGLGLPVENAKTGGGGTVGRLQIARAMMEKGYVHSTAEAFARYIGDDGPAYVPGERLRVAEALPLIRQSGYLPVLAHPCELKVDEPTLTQLVDRWIGLGLMGMEVYHPSAMYRDMGFLDRLARSRGLLVTGGSDFHEHADGQHGEIGSMIPFWQRAGEDAEALLSALAAHQAD